MSIVDARGETKLTMVKTSKMENTLLPSLWFRWEATRLHVQQQKLLFRCVSYFLNDISLNHLEEWEYWQTGLNQEIPEIWLKFYFFFFFLETPPDIQIKRNTSANQREIMRYENDWRAATEWRARGAVEGIWSPISLLSLAQSLQLSPSPITSSHGRTGNN